MAKRKAARKPRSGRARRKVTSAKRSVKHQKLRGAKAAKASARKKARPRKPLAARRAAAQKPAKKAASRKAARQARVTARRAAGRAAKAPRLDRERRILSEPTPPSSLDLDRHGSAARSGRHELQHNIEEHTGMTAAITGGDVDADWENAYFSGDEAPGGDNPTPDQDRVDDIGRSIGLQYADNEELKGDEKVEERDRHRWELDPASSEDYRERK